MEWISVKDQLPEIDQKVLVWNIKFPDPEFLDIGYYDPDSCPDTCWRCEEYMSIEPTHWMPLPEPPEDTE
jgi:hypothetical protein